MNRVKLDLSFTALVVMLWWGPCGWAPHLKGQAPAPASPASDTATTGAAQSAGETREIKLTAKKYEFSPDTITVEQGQNVKLLITAVDHDHGLKIGEFDVNQLIKKVTTAAVEFTLTQAGTFQFQCSHFCGLGQPKIHGKLIVEGGSATKTH